VTELHDWTTTLDDEKTISGYATQTVDGVEENVGDMAGWTGPELILRHQKTGKHYTFTATLTTATGLFSYTLQQGDLSKPGVYEVAFRATTAAGSDHTFPEGQKKTLMVHPRLDA
jgi:hypothetical protein